jgi:hypothetical protein
MDKPLLELSEYSGIGLIIEYSSGVRYTNQTGGYACLHPEVEGVFVPLTHPQFSQQEELERFFTGPKWGGHCYASIDEETADFLDSVFSGNFRTQALKVNRAKLAESHEAWIHVTVSPDGEASEMWSGFCNALGIVTWENSD